MNALRIFTAVFLLTCASHGLAQSGLLFYLSGEQGTTADYSAPGTATPTFEYEVSRIGDGAVGAALRCADTQRLAYAAPGNIYAQRGTLAFYWRSRYPVGPTEFPLFRVAYADHSSWDMVFLRIDYNGHGFDAFVTDASLSRTRVSTTVAPFPQPTQWAHLAFAWDETRGVVLYVDGKRVAERTARAVYDAALDQFGAHSRIISPHNVQSDYNFVRGGDLDELRIYDHMLSDAEVATLAKGKTSDATATRTTRDLADPIARAEWRHRYGWDNVKQAPPMLPPGRNVSIRKVEILDAYDLKRWWWKANDGIRETTWPGVYNRSRLPGRNDYLHLPDWDAYSISGKSITFFVPDEDWNQIEISGAAFGSLSLIDDPDAAGRVLFERPRGIERSANRIAPTMHGGKLRFDNIEQEQPIGEFATYNISTGAEPADAAKLSFRLRAPNAADQPAIASLSSYIAGRHPAGERATLVAVPVAQPQVATKAAGTTKGTSSLVHIIVPDSWDEREDGLDGIAIDLPAWKLAPTYAGTIAFNLSVKDPLWPLRDMLDVSFSIKPGEAKTVWLDLRDRLLPHEKPLYLTLAAGSVGLSAETLDGVTLRLVFKPHSMARVEHIVDRFTQMRDNYAMLVEERPHSEKFALWKRFNGDLQDLLRIDPQNVLALNYRAAEDPELPRPTFTKADIAPGVPAWAQRQVEALAGVQRFVRWWIDERQIDNGEFGGGLSDDVDLTNLWPGIALMGVLPDKVTDSLRRELDAIYREGMFTNGLPTIQTDELHSYEEGINALGQNLIVDFGNPKQLERAMENARGIETITGINSAGHRHIRSSYYSGTRMAVEEPWGQAKAQAYLALQPGQLLVDYNGNAHEKNILLELADGLLAHRKRADDGSYALPNAIRFDDDSDQSGARRYLPWPLFWTAWVWTGERRYLDPILDAGISALPVVNANLLDRLDLRASWGPRILAREATRSLEGRAANDARGAGPQRHESMRTIANAHFEWQLSREKSRLVPLYESQIDEMQALEYINTQGSLWTDRVGVPTADLQRARLGGVALTRNNTAPGHIVSWRFAAPAQATDVAILVADATPHSFKVIAHNLSDNVVQAAMSGWNIDPGIWEIEQGIDSRDADRADREIGKRDARFERSRAIQLTFAAHATTIVRCRLKTAGTPYWQRPDLGIGEDDVQIHGREIRVRVHSLGNVAAPPTTIVLRDRHGRIFAIEHVPALAAPDDLLPKTVDIAFALPAGVGAADVAVEIDPEQTLDEITRLNNVLTLH